MTISPRTMAFSLVTAALAVLLLGGCSASRPSVSVRNDSDVMVGARVWVGDRGNTGSGSRRSDRVLSIKPGATAQYWVAETAGFQSPAESYVQLQVWTIDASFETPVEYWFEVLPPGPYSVVLTGPRDSLHCESAGEGKVALVPRELWITTAESPKDPSK